MVDMTATTEDAATLLQSAAEATGYAGLLSRLPDEAAQAFRILLIDPMEVRSIVELSPRAVLDLLRSTFQAQWHTPVRVCLQLCGALLLTAVCAALLQGKHNAAQTMTFLGGSIQLVLLLQGVSGILRDGAAAIAACAAFEKASVPVLAVLLTLSGRPTAALSLQGAAFSAAQALESFSAEAVVPLAASLSAAGAVGALVNDPRIRQLAEEGRKLLLRLFAAAAGLFSAFLSLKAVIASSVDGLAVRGVKLAGSFLPVVGSAVGEAYATAIGAFALLKNTAGVVLILALLALCLPVLIRLIVWIAALRLTGYFGLLIDAAGRELPQVMAELLSAWIAVISMSCIVCIVTAGLTVMLGGGA